MFKEFETRCLALDYSAANLYTQIVAANTRSGNPISVEDAQIASIALYKKLPFSHQKYAGFRKN
jgi:predicted nucleic acid-binding protein